MSDFWERVHSSAPPVGFRVVAWTTNSQRKDQWMNVLGGGPQENAENPWTTPKCTPSDHKDIGYFNSRNKYIDLGGVSSCRQMTEAQILSSNFDTPCVGRLPWFGNSATTVPFSSLVFLYAGFSSMTSCGIMNIPTKLEGRSSLATSSLQPATIL